MHPLLLWKSNKYHIFRERERGGGGRGESAMLMRRVMLSSVAYPALPSFSILSHKRNGKSFST